MVNWSSLLSQSWLLSMSPESWLLSMYTQSSLLRSWKLWTFGGHLLICILYNIITQALIALTCHASTVITHVGNWALTPCALHHQLWSCDGNYWYNTKQKRMIFLGNVRWLKDSTAPLMNGHVNTTKMHTHVQAIIHVQATASCFRDIIKMAVLQLSDVICTATIRDKWGKVCAPQLRGC